MKFELFTKIYEMERNFFAATENNSASLLIGRIVFLTREKYDTRLLIGRIIFVTREMTIRAFWLAKNNKRTKIYEMDFEKVNLDMYMINLFIYHRRIESQVSICLKVLFFYIIFKTL